MPDQLTGENVYEYLNVNKDRALRRVARLLNAGHLYDSLVEAKSYLDDNNSASGLAAEMENMQGLYFDFTYEEIPSTADIATATLVSQAVGVTFLQFVGDLWGVDENGALLILADDYDIVPGNSYREILSTVQITAALASLGTLAVLTGGGSVPSSLLLLSFITGTGASLLELIDQRATMSEAEFNERLALILVQAIIEQTALRLVPTSSSGAALAGILARPGGRVLIEEWGVFASDLILGGSGNYTSNVETLRNWLLANTELTFDQATEITEGFLENASTFDAYGVVVPPGTHVNTVPVTVSNPGSSELEFGVTNPYEAGAYTDDGRESPDPPGAPSVGADSQQEVYDAIVSRPDFIAWYRAREADYFAANPGTTTSFHDAISESGIRAHYAPGVRAPELYEDLVYAAGVFNIGIG